MAWTPATAAFFVGLGLLLATMTWLARTRPEAERVGVPGIPPTRGARLFLSLVLAAVIPLADRRPGDRRRHRIVEPVARHSHFVGRCRGRVPYGLGRRDQA